MDVEAEVFAVSVPHALRTGPAASSGATTVVERTGSASSVVDTFRLSRLSVGFRRTRPLSA